MENIPTELYHENIFLSLPIDSIYNICSAQKVNYKYCDDVLVWRKYFMGISHMKVQDVVKNAAKKGIFRFIKFLCENYQIIEIFLDVRTLTYCYYYFAERNNLMAVDYIYDYLITKYGNKKAPILKYNSSEDEDEDDSDDEEEEHEKNDDAYGVGNKSLPVKIYNELKNLKKLTKIIVSIAEKVDDSIKLLYAKLNLYDEYIAEYIVESNPDYDWSNLIKPSLFPLNKVAKISYFAIVRSIFAYLVRTNKKLVVNKILDMEINEALLIHLKELTLKQTFIKNCSYKWYIEEYGEKVFTPAPEGFRSKQLFKLYWEKLVIKKISILTYGYQILSADEMITYVKQLTTDAWGEIFYITEWIRNSRKLGYTYWAEEITRKVLADYGRT